MYELIVAVSPLPLMLGVQIQINYSQTKRIKCQL